MLRHTLNTSFRMVRRQPLWLSPCVGARSFWKKRTPAAPKGTPLHVKLDIPEPGKDITAAAATTDIATRQEWLIENTKVWLPSDAYDQEVPDFSPYETRELVKDSVWRVRYFFDAPDDDEDTNQWLKAFGADFSDPDAAKRAPVKVQHLIEEDLATVGRMTNDPDFLFAQYRLGAYDSLDMLVAKLETGGLLLYSPHRFHPEIVAWLAERGEVEWIVVPQSQDIHMVPHALETYPNAKLFTSDSCDAKLSGKCKPPDYTYNTADSLAMAREKLAAEGVQVVPIQGEVFCQPLAVLAHGHLFNSNLLFGHADGDMHTMVTREQWEAPGWPGAHARLPYYQALTASPNGILPPWRFGMLDPTNPFSKFNMPEPKEDGSSCTELAASLRELLKLDFEFADDMESRRPGSMPADEFRACIEAGWSWLDGKSLLP